MGCKRVAILIRGDVARFIGAGFKDAFEDISRVAQLKEISMEYEKYA